MGNLISEETLHKLEADTSFQQLSQKMQTLNIFEVLGITNAEIRHSNFLAWLLDPNGNHGMGDKFLREFVSKLGQREVVPENVTVCIVSGSTLTCWFYARKKNTCCVSKIKCSLESTMISFAVIGIFC